MILPSFRLHTLGRLGLFDRQGVEEPSLATRRRKLAVLAVLAMERRPVSRDSLVEMFWGDQDEARARHSLSDVLSHLRRVLGRDAITIGRSEVVLSSAAPVAVDAEELIAAASAAQHERVLQLYAGPFLNAVYVGGSASFEHWVERTGGRIAAHVARARRERCTQLARARAWDECAGVAARWLDDEPLSSDAALFHLNALKAPGTPEALRLATFAFESLRARVARDYGVPLSADVTALAHRMRERLAEELPPVRAAPLAPSSAAGEPAPPSPPVASEPAVPSVTPPTEAQPLPVPAWRSKRRTLSTVATIVVIGAALVATLRAARDARAVPPSPTRLAVLPFEVHGGTGVGYLRRGMTDLLSTSLDGAGALRTVDPRIVLAAVPSSDSSAFDAARGRTIAMRVGAGLFVVGEVVQAGDALRLSASLFDATRGAEATAVASATTVGAPWELFQLVDRLTSQLLAGRSRSPGDQLERIAAVTTASLPALKAYLQGEDDYRVGRYGAAYEEFQRAVAEDSGFALAHYRLAKTATWGAIWQWDSIVAGSGRAVRHSNRLSRRSRLLVEAFDAWMRGSYDDAERLYRTVVASWPSDVEAWFELGEVLYHCNPLRGRPPAEARDAFEHVLALEPAHRGALVHLIRIAGAQKRQGEVDSLVARAIEVSGEEWALELRLFQAALRGDRATESRLVPQLRVAPDVLLERSVSRIALYLRDLDAAQRLTPILLEPSRSVELQGEATVWLADIAAAHGRASQAEPVLRRAARSPWAYALVERTLLATRPFLARPRPELLALRDTLARWDGTAARSSWPAVAVYDGYYPQLREYLLGLLAIQLGDTADAERHAAALQASTRGVQGDRSADVQAHELARGLSQSLRAHVAASRGDVSDALDRFERARLHVSEGLLESPAGTQAADRWARAELLHRSGRDGEALAWYATLPDAGMHGLVYLAPTHLRQAQIYDHRGDRVQAARHYRRFVELWQQCDPALRPLVTEARARLAVIGDG